MCIKGRSPNLRYVPRTHRVDLDWLIERIKLDPGVNLKYVGTNEQMADLLTKASFTIAKWNSLLRLHQIGLLGGVPSRVENKPAQVTKIARVHKGKMKIMKSACLLYTSPSPRDGLLSRMPSSA